MDPDRSILERLLRQACAELEQRLRTGTPGRAEDFLAAHPALASDANAVLELIYTEFVLRNELGERTDPVDWFARFPQWRADLQELFQIHDFVQREGRHELARTVLMRGSAAGRQTLSAIAGISTPPERRLGNYELLEEVGRGGMGVVYRARQLGLERMVALKMILAGALAGLEDLARFRREGEAAARLQHPNIVLIYEVGAHDGRPYFSLEFVGGGNLEKMLEGKPLPAREAARHAETLARAMHYAHRQGIVHRDLKPANVLRTPDGVLKIADFGLAKLLDGVPGGPVGEPGASATGARTQTGAILGTPSYMAPEQAGGKTRDVGPAADVHALGAILYEMLTGRPPFLAETSLETLLQVVSQEPVPPRQLQPKIPIELETICLKCLEKDPPQRYTTAEDLAEDLRRFLHDEPIGARPAGPWRNLHKFARRHKLAVGAAAAVFLTLVLGIIGTGLGLARATQERDRARQAESQTREERDRAQKAERQAHMHGAHLAMQSGSWRTALEKLDRARAAGAEDTIDFRLDQVRAWCAVNELSQALRELEALARRKDLGRRRSSVLLWQGDLALARSVNDIHALELVRQTSRGQLPPAEAAYARGLLARTSPAALDHFLEALRLDPLHQRAHGMAGFLLIALGRLPEARERVGVARLRFPEDPTFQVLAALICALEGDRSAALALVNQAGKQLSPEERATVEGLVGAIEQIRRAMAAMSGGRTYSVWEVYQEVLPHGTKIWVATGARRHKKGKGPIGLSLPLPPVFASTFRRLPGRLLAAGLGRIKPAVEECEQVARIHPDGLFHFLRGILHYQKEQWEPAEQAFLAAATASSPFGDLRKLALYGAIGCEGVLLRQTGADWALKQKAVRNIRRLIALAGISPAQGPLLTKVALAAEDLDLARWVVAQWQRQAPHDRAALRMRAMVELKGSAYGRALAAVKEVLEVRPGDRQALSLREMAIDQLLKEAKAVRQP
jgi:tetratricopeptide (TPR) repeat protein